MAAASDLPFFFGDVCPFLQKASESVAAVSQSVASFVCQLVSCVVTFFSLRHLWPMGVPIGGTCYRDESRVATDSGARAAAAAAPAA